MNVPAEIVTVALGAVAALQGWTLREVVKMKVSIATIAASCPNQNPAMKNPCSKFLISPMLLVAGFLFLLAMLLFSGCKTAGGLFTARPVVTPSLVVTQTTNATPSIVQSNGVPIGTNWTLTVATETNVVWSTNTVYETAPQVAAALGSGAAVTPLIPAPYGPIATGGLALATALLAWLARLKSGQANAAIEESANVATQLDAVIRGIEAAKIGEAEKKLVKETVQGQAAMAGVQPELHSRVLAVT